MEKLATANHVSALLNEVDYLRTLIQPHDTGHIHTAINVLHEHIEQLLKEIMENETNT
jgi:hypothetical protein